MHVHTVHILTIYKMFGTGGTFTVIHTYISCLLNIFISVNIDNCVELSVVFTYGTCPVLLCILFMKSSSCMLVILFFSYIIYKVNPGWGRQSEIFIYKVKNNPLQLLLHKVRIQNV
jgi:hypothetical protein